ncbi:MAG TPA: hypothetical protein VI844_00685 [Coxiellaceae bacterium]|nr:hypothetical protein [Coxiellaceae bacterium]
MKKFYIVTLWLFIFFLSSCSFEPRSARYFPKELDRVYLSTEKPYSPLATNFNALLRSMHAEVVKKNSDAPYSIIISNDVFSYSRPVMVDSSLPSTLNFSQTATLTIRNNKNDHDVLSKVFSTAQSLTLNANQIYTQNANTLIQQSLNREMISLIYYWLISSHTKDALQHVH